MRTRESARRLEKLQETPLDVLCKGMLMLWDRAKAETDKTAQLALVKDAISAAAQAAPYMHARITSVSATVRTIGSLKDLSDEELAALAASVGAAASSPAVH